MEPAKKILWGLINETLFFQTKKCVQISPPFLGYVCVLVSLETNSSHLRHCGWFLLGPRPSGRCELLILGSVYTVPWISGTRWPSATNPGPVRLFRPYPWPVLGWSRKPDTGKKSSIIYHNIYISYNINICIFMSHLCMHICIYGYRLIDTNMYV